MIDREWQIDFHRILDSLRRGAACILILGVEGALAAYLGTLLLATPQYCSSVVFCGNNLKPAASCAIVLQSQETLETILLFSGIGRTYEELADMLSLTILDPAEFFRVTVTSPDPREAELIADGVAKVLPVRMADILEGSTAKPLDAVVSLTEEVDPGQGRNAILGAAAGLLLGLAVACGDGVLDTVIRRRENLESLCPYPILTTIFREGGYSMSSKLLRAKLAHLFPEEETCILGITSSLGAEEKALVAEHLAVSLKKQGKRVILLDLDGKPEKTGTSLGLTDFLSGREELCRVIQHRPLAGEEIVVIPPGKEIAGEWLSSPEMEALLGKFRGAYDYVLLNLPSMEAAGDVLPLAGKLDGILVCVQRDACHANALTGALEQLAFVEARILGLVYQDFSPEEKNHRPATPLAGVETIREFGKRKCVCAGSNKSSSKKPPSEPR